MLSPSAYSKANVHEKVTCPAPAALREIRTALIALGQLTNESNPESSTACIRGEPSSQAKGSRRLRTSPGGAGEGFAAGLVKPESLAAAPASCSASQPAPAREPPAKPPMEETSRGTLRPRGGWRKHTRACLSPSSSGDFQGAKPTPHNGVNRENVEARAFLLSRML